VFVGTGDYAVDIEVGDSPERLSRLDLSLRADARREDAGDPWWRQIRLSSFARVRNLTRAPFADLVNPFRGRFYDDGPNTVDGSLSLRNEVTLAPKARVIPRVRWERNRRADGRFDTVRELREEDIGALEIRGAPKERWTTRVELAREREADIVDRADAPRVADVFHLTRATVGAVHKPSPAWSIGGDVIRERVEADDAEGIETRTELVPTIAYAPPTFGRIELRGRRVWVDNLLPRRRPVFEFGLDARSGIEWAVLADYRVREFITLGGTFRSVRPDDEDSRFDGRLELRAFF
jgi:hypothetical protein